MLLYPYERSLDVNLHEDTAILERRQELFGTVSSSSGTDFSFLCYCSISDNLAYTKKVCIRLFCCLELLYMIILLLKPKTCIFLDFLTELWKH